MTSIMRGLQRSRICSMVRPAVFRPSPSPYCRQLLRHNLGSSGSGSSSVHARPLHYQPNQGPHPPVYFQEPKKPKKRIVRDMLLGSLLTVAAGFFWGMYKYHSTLSVIEADVEADAEAATLEYEEFREQFARAREAGDEAKLREATFGFVRCLGQKRTFGAATEVGPLPMYPEDDELKGKERVPAEDTLMFVETDDDDYITAVQVAINLDLEELETAPVRDNGNDDDVDVNVDRNINSNRNRHPRQLSNPSEDKLAELLWRFEWQVEDWRNQDRLRGGRMLVMFALRDRLWMFTYAYDPWDSITVIALE